MISFVPFEYFVVEIYASIFSTTSAAVASARTQNAPNLRQHHRGIGDGLKDVTADHEVEGGIVVGKGHGVADFEPDARSKRRAPRSRALEVRLFQIDADE